MPIDYEVEVLAQSSVYDKSIAGNYNRKLKVYFSVPSAGVNDDTGLLLLIAGYQGYASSNIYKKMRKYFADRYNLVTLQCNYFGYEFMQYIDKTLIPDGELQRVFSSEEIARIYQNGHFNHDTLINVGRSRAAEIRLKADLSQESAANFNEMSVMQALDNIVAVLNVANILYDNDNQFNTKRIIAYGHSHGAYLSYLCNAFIPGFFSLLVDNSAWLRPGYLKQNRQVSWKEGNLKFLMVYEYIAKKLLTDLEILELPFVYDNFKNNSRIIAYQGATDLLIDKNEKLAFCNKLNCECMIISETEVDNRIFKSTDHGLGADFIKLFDFTMDNFDIRFEKDSFLDFQTEVVFNTSKHKYIIDYQKVFPRLTIV